MKYYFLELPTTDHNPTLHCPSSYAKTLKKTPK